MPFEHPYIRIRDLKPVKMDAGEGWSISEFRVVISEKEGCSSTMFHAVFAPGDVHHRHRFEGCDMMYYIVSGHGLAGAGPDRAEVHAGHYHFIPKGVERWLVNLSRNEPLVILGLYDRAPSPGAAGYVYAGEVTDADRKAPRTLDTAKLQYPLVHQDAVPLVKVSKEQGWTQDYFCEPFNRSHGVGSCWMYGYFGPHTVHMKHRHDNCEEICYILKGHGLAGVGADRGELVAGDVHYIPAGTEHWLANLDDEEDLAAPGWYIGVGGLDESGFNYMGPVTGEDLKQRTGAL
ncbi:MAG: cupin domain-containing protein [bacterium]|nr:cupin domain-containing protein [bacterium]